MSRNAKCNEECKALRDCTSLLCLVMLILFRLHNSDPSPWSLILRRSEAFSFLPFESVIQFQFSVAHVQQQIQ